MYRKIYVTRVAYTITYFHLCIIYFFASMNVWPPPTKRRSWQSSMSAGCNLQKLTRRKLLLLLGWCFLFQGVYNCTLNNHIYFSSTLIIWQHSGGPIANQPILFLHTVSNAGVLHSPTVCKLQPPPNLVSLPTTESIWSGPESARKLGYKLSCWISISVLCLQILPLYRPIFPDLLTLNDLLPCILTFPVLRKPPNLSHTSPH